MHRVQHIFESSIIPNDVSHWDRQKQVNVRRTLPSNVILITRFYFNFMVLDAGGVCLSNASIVLA